MVVSNLVRAPSLPLIPARPLFLTEYAPLHFVQRACLPQMLVQARLADAPRHLHRQLRRLLLVVLLISRPLLPASPAAAQHQWTISVEEASTEVQQREAHGPAQGWLELQLSTAACSTHAVSCGNGRGSAGAQRGVVSATRLTSSNDEPASQSTKRPPATIALLSERPIAAAKQAASKIVEGVNEVRTHISPAERDTILLLSATALVTPFMGVLGLSPVLGFLFAGMVLGPAGLGVISDVETTTKLAELGVVFFLFEMGLEV